MVEERIVSHKIKSIDESFDILWVPSVVWDLFVLLNHEDKGKDFSQYNSVVPLYYAEFMAWMLQYHENFLKFSGRKDSSIERDDTNLYARTIHDILKKFFKEWKLRHSKIPKHRNSLHLLAREIELVRICVHKPKIPCRSLLVSSIKVELEARLTNRVPLFRFSKGVSFRWPYPAKDKRFSNQINWRNFDLIDFPGEKNIESIRQLSYSYSILAGIIRDSHPMTGACVYSFSMSCPYVQYTYAILLDKRWLYNRGTAFFYLPAVSLHNSVLGAGETFHPRTLSFSPTPDKYPKSDRHRWLVDHRWPYKPLVQPTRRAFYEDFLPEKRLAEWNNGLKLNLLDKENCVIRYSRELNKVIAEGLVLLKFHAAVLENLWTNPILLSIKKEQLEFGNIYGKNI